ncbi:MAG: flavin reductase [bacterium]|nr:flavin reductase [bacterium]
MSKVSVPASNDCCPQTLFVYGTFREGGRPNFGLFCWFSYFWKEQLSVMCAIGGSKETLNNIRRNRVFSANLVTESNLALADYFGTADGRDADKMDVPVEWEKGQVLDVPVLVNTPCAFELELEKEIPTDDQDNVILLCRIRNTLKEESILDPALTTQEKYKAIAAVRTTGDQDYWSLDGRHLGKWHEPAQKIKPGVQIGKAAQGN